MTTVIVSGALASRSGNGGGAWVRLNWILGLRRLDFDVVFLEQMHGDPSSPDARRQADWFEAVTARFGLGGRAALLWAGGWQTRGLSSAEVLDAADDAALLINMSGHLHQHPVLRRVARRVYLDLDPGFTQCWEASGIPGARMAGHDLYFTVGANVGKAGCGVPTNGIAWRHVRPPVVLDEWPPVPPPADRSRFTTVASWRGAYGPISWAGRLYGAKAHEFRRFLGLPRMVPGRFEIALDVHPGDAADLSALRRAGWRVVDPRRPCANPQRYRAYLQASAAEFSVAQGVYVHTGSGWFSDRTAEYLACGRPVLVQDTGLSSSLPVGDGLVVFRTRDEAAEGAARILRDYAAHARAARALAEEYFDSDRVLGGFMDDVGVAP